MQDNILLHIDKVAVGYSKANTLLNNVNLQFERGSFHLLVGANGTGKSTLIKSLVGLLPIWNGSIKISQKELASYSKQQIAQQIAFIPSSNSYASSLTVLDVLTFARIPHKNWIQKMSNTDHEWINRVVAQIGIKNLLTSKYNQLSEGQKQLVNIAKALVQDTSIIILDEPTAHLDLVNKRKVFKLLQTLSEDQKLIICVTHDVYNSFGFSDYIISIDANAKMKQIATSKTTIEHIIEQLF